MPYLRRFITVPCLTALFVLISSVFVSVDAADPPAPVAAAEESDTGSRRTEGCRYGEGGPNAKTICWIDMASYDEALAGSTGQNRTVTVGDYQLTFTIRKNLSYLDRWRQLDPVSPNEYPGFVFGRDSYSFSDDPAYKPVLYQQSSDEFGYTGFLELQNIKVTNHATNEVISSGFSVISAEVGSLSEKDRVQFEANVPVSVFKFQTPEGYREACGGTLDISEDESGFKYALCSDPGGDLNPGMVTSIARDPKTVGIAFSDRTKASRIGVAFGIMFSEVQVGKTISGPRVHAEDQFRVAAGLLDQTPLSQVITSGDGLSFQDEPHMLKLENPDRTVIFSEHVANATTDLTAYQQSWECVRNDEPIPQAEIASLGPAPRITLESGDFVSCAVRNSPTPHETPSPTSSPTPQPSPTAAPVLPDTGGSGTLLLTLCGTLALIGGAAVALSVRRSHRR